MAYFYNGGQQENPGNGAVNEVEIANVAIPAHSRVIFRMIEGWTDVAAGNNAVFYMNQGAVAAANRIWGNVTPDGPGRCGGETFVHVGALTAATTFRLSGYLTGGTGAGVFVGGQFSGIYNP